ncbi:MAG: Mo-dependent nitrogenase C-terminal domain-containing protein [Synechococcaceae cyanobacterium]|nr:Mo-dependent nitrogenase C-terminal domain-containing protein [Synechococcaceae cyanobacterium]
MTTALPRPSHSSGDPETARRHLWLAALHQLALADGDFSPEEERLLEEELERELPGVRLEGLHRPGAEALVHRFGAGTPRAEEFLRTAVLVALADGSVSPIELEWLRHWSEVLQVGAPVIRELEAGAVAGGAEGVCDTHDRPERLDGVRRWLDGIDPREPAVARFLVRLIPAQCPFERDVTLFGRKVVHIPPMCKINPLYEQLVALRFRCLCRLEEPGAPLPRA